MLHALIFTLVAQVTPPPTPPPLTPVATPSAAASPAGQIPGIIPIVGPSVAPGATPAVTPSPSPTPSGPQLTLSVPQVQLNPAQQTTVLVSGASPPLQATLDNKLVNVSVNPDATSVTITATQQTGSDVLHLIDANGAQATLPIQVEFNAGTIVPTASLQVTGSPVDGSWLVARVMQLVGHLTQAMPGAQTTFGEPVPPAPTPLPPGAAMQFNVPVQIAGNGQYFDQSGSTLVNVQNVPVTPFAPSLLFYDDDPEYVSADGVLFRGAVSVAQPARLYYYHDDVGTPHRIVVVLDSPGVPASVQVVGSSAGPNADVMSVGSALTRKFLAVQPPGEGTIVNLLPDAPEVLDDVTMQPTQGVAGTLDVRVLDGGPVTVTVLSVSPGVAPLGLLDGPLLPGDGHHRKGIFSLAGTGVEALAYAVGGPNATLTIGGRSTTLANLDPQSPNHDYGSYGVLQSIALTLTNPTAQPATAYLYIRPLAGIARGTFLIDGRPFHVGCVREPIPYEIAAYALAPGATERSSVQTMTDGGSFYPIEIGVTGTPPQPFAPPISAPDGCFPKPLASPTPSGLPPPAPSGPPTPAASGPPAPGPSGPPPAPGIAAPPTAAPSAAPTPDGPEPPPPR